MRCVIRVGTHCYNSVYSWTVKIHAVVVDSQHIFLGGYRYILCAWHNLIINLKFRVWNLHDDHGGLIISKPKYIVLRLYRYLGIIIRLKKKTLGGREGQNNLFVKILQPRGRGYVNIFLFYAYKIIEITNRKIT